MSNIQEIERILKIQKEELCCKLPSKLQKEFDEKCYISGGCIYSYVNGEKPKDIDFFVTDEKFIEVLLDFFKHSSNHKSFITNYAISYRQFQIITKFYGEPEKVVSEFDFLHNMFYLDFNDKIKTLSDFKYLYTSKLYINENRIRDISNVLFRVPKYIARNRTISKYEHCKLLKKLQENGFDERELEILNENSKSFFVNDNAY